MSLASVCLWLVAASAVAGGGQPGEGLTLSRLQELLADCRVNSIEALLPRLPAAFRARYALMFRSRARSRRATRARASFSMATMPKLVLSFNGEPQQRGFEALEAMEFDDAAEAFHYREVVFRPCAAVARSAPLSALSWQPSASRLGYVSDPAGRLRRTLPSALSDEEKTGLAAFLQRQPDHPRYRYLFSVPGASTEQDLFSTDVRRGITYNGVVRNAPNAELGALLSRLNLRVVAAEIAASPRFATFGPFLLAALETQCSPPLGARPFEAFRRALVAANDEQARLKEWRTLHPGPVDPEAGTPEVRLAVPLRRGGGPRARDRHLDDRAGEGDLRLHDFRRRAGGPRASSRAEARGSPRARGAAVLGTDPARYCAYLERWEGRRRLRRRKRRRKRRRGRHR